MKKLFTLLGASVLISSALNAQINTFPHVTDFESEGLCGSSCTGTCNLTGHWRNADQWGFPQAGTDWLSEDGSTPSSDTGPDVDHTLNSSVGKYAYTETSGCTNVSGHLVSGIYDFSNNTSPRINFWYHMYGATMGTMHLDADTTGNGDWVLDIVPAWTNNVNQWLEMDVPIAILGGRPNTRIRIRATTGTSFTSDMAVDDITVYQPQPNDLELSLVSVGGGCGNSVTTPVDFRLINVGTDSLYSGDSIQASFDVGGNISTETFYINTTVAPGDTLHITFVNSFVDLSGPNPVNVTGWISWLTDLTQANDTLGITTIGIPIITSYPYLEDFESGVNGWVINNLQVGTWAFGTPAKPVINSAASGVNCFVTGGLTGTYNNTEQAYVEGPCFDFTNVCDPVLEMNVWWNAEFSWDGMNVTYSTDGGQTWLLSGNLGDPFNWYTDNTIVGAPGGFQSGWSGRNATSNGSGGWVSARHRLLNAGGSSNVKIRMNFGTDGSVVDDGVAFDDVHIFNGTDLGDDILACAPASIPLNADHGNSNATYLWSNGSTSSSIAVTSTGTYHVAITADPNCITYDTVYVLVADVNTTVQLGADTSACTDSLLLNAGNWPQSVFAWSNGDGQASTWVQMSGMYDVQITNACGTYADTIQVVLSADDTLSQYFTECAGFTVTVGNNQYSATGIYIDSLSNSNGCDSIITTYLTVNPAIDTSVTVNGFVLEANATGVTYQWYDCTTNAAVPGETSAVFNPLADGLYAVIISDGLCSDTSACYAVIGMDADLPLAEWIHIFPNPTASFLQIETGVVVAEQIQLVDVAGKIYTTLTPNQSIVSIDLSVLASGMYFVQVMYQGERFITPVVKK